MGMVLEDAMEPFTDELLYHYDFGDGWRVRITASDDCPDLVESGRISQKELIRQTSSAGRNIGRFSLRVTAKCSLTISGA